MGYHQLAVALASQEKLAFQGPNAIKWTFTVMPFGPMNGPATFINFIHDIDSQWKALAQQSGLVIDDNMNMKIIVTFSADQIIVLDDGTIKEKGTHQELITLENGIYKNLSNLQFNNF